MKLYKMDCPYCGASIEADVNNRKFIFCTYCGKQIQLKNDSDDITINQNISINKNITQRVTNDAEILKEQNRHRESAWKLIIVCTLSALLFVVIVGLSLGRGKKESANIDQQVKVENEKANDNNADIPVAEERKEADPKNNNNTHNENVSASSSERKQIELIESGYSVGQNDHHTFVHYAVKLHNPNKEYAIRFPRIIITAKDENGAILTTDDMTLNAIAANDTIVYGNTEMYEGKLPDSVVISLGENDDYQFITQSGSDIIRQEELVITNVSKNSGLYDSTITGEVTNESGVDLRDVAVIAILKKDNKMVGGIVDYADSIKSGKTVPFEIREHYDIDYDSYEIYGMQW